MSIISATYSPDDNKIRLYASSRLDAETYARVKTAGFAWAPKQELFVAPMWTPSREDLAIDLAGEINDEDTSLCERAEVRADRFAGYRENRTADAHRAHAAVDSVAQRFEAGQPILVGHHSERKARKDAERIESGMRRAVNAFETAQYWKDRAAGALAHARYKELPDVRARRIKGLQADARKVLRQIEEAQTKLRVWLKVERYEYDRQSAVALAIANRMSAPTLPTGESMYSALSARRVHGDYCWRFAVPLYERYIEQVGRWVTHYDNRLTYEIAMLNEQGAGALLDKKPRPKQLPLVNYRAEGGAITVPNRYQRGEVMRLEQVDMTAAQYAAINTNYKGTREVTNSHRIRTAVKPGKGYGLVCVFITDSKVHPIPAPIDPAPRDLPQPRMPRPVVVDPHAATLAGLKSALKSGVQVVSAPQLFPTPVDLARQMRDALDLQPGMSVLEPSAGTGRLLDALPRADVDIRAVEINVALVRALNASHPHVAILCGDFLEMTPAQLGTFDRIIMNPPFGNAQDVKHIEHARRFLKPGGRLVALCAAGPRQAAAFEDSTEWVELPRGSFESEGTGVNVAMITIDAAEMVTQ